MIRIAQPGIVPPVRPVLCPDEYALGYLGRVSSINGWSKTEQVLSDLTGWVRRVDSSLTDAPPIQVLATAAGYDASTFIKGHTLLPLTLELGRDVVRSSETNDSRIGRDLMLRGGGSGDLALCPACLDEHIESDTAPYWRRAHQIPGLHWCLTHGEQLIYSYRENSYLTSPAIYRKYPPPIHEAAFRAQWECQAIHRYAEICVRLLEYFVPLNPRHVIRTARARALQLGLRTETKDRSAEPLREFLRRRLPASWLTSLYGSAFHPNPSARTPRLDLIISGERCRLPVTAYAAVFAAMYPTVEAAMEALFPISERDASAHQGDRAAA